MRVIYIVASAVSLSLSLSLWLWWCQQEVDANMVDASQKGAGNAAPPLGSTDAIDLDKLVMNFLVVEGHKDAAEAFQKESGVSPGTDLRLVEQRMKIK